MFFVHYVSPSSITSSIMVLISLSIFSSIYINRYIYFSFWIFFLTPVWPDLGDKLKLLRLGSYTYFLYKYNRSSNTRFFSFLSFFLGCPLPNIQNSGVFVFQAKNGCLSEKFQFVFSCQGLTMILRNLWVKFRNQMISHCVVIKG